MLYRLPAAQLGPAWRHAGRGQHTTCYVWLGCTVLCRLQQPYGTSRSCMTVWRSHVTAVQLTDSHRLVASGKRIGYKLGAISATCCTVSNASKPTLMSVQQRGTAVYSGSLTGQQGLGRLGPTVAKEPLPTTFKVRPPEYKTMQLCLRRKECHGHDHSFSARH
jgi:hypothetical protein